MPEQQNIEYKSNWHDDYLKWVCGFANAQDGGFFVTLFAKPSEKVRNRFGIDSEQIRNKLGKEIAQTLNLIKEHPDNSAKDLAKLAGKSSRTIEKHIAKLKNEGIIIRKESNKVGYWEINTNTD